MKENVKVGRGSDSQKNRYVLLTVGKKQIPLDPERAEEIADALKAAAHDVRLLRTSRELPGLKSN